MKEKFENQELHVAGAGQNNDDSEVGGPTMGEQNGKLGSDTGCCAALETCTKELASYKNQFLRTRADLENLTRRIEKERVQFVSVGQRSVLLDMLCVVDDFDRALRDHRPEELKAISGGTGDFDVREPSAPEGSTEQEGVQKSLDAVHARDVVQDRQVWLAGFELIRSSLYKLLEKYGVTPMPVAQYAVFDPYLHEAIMHIASADHKPGEIVQVLLNGFMFGDQVLRPAQVSVAK